MTAIGKLLRLVAASVVPGGGFLWAGWSPATTLTLYWVDNLVGSLAMGARIAIHRRSTGLAGHTRGYAGAASSTGDGQTQTFQSYLAEFLTTSLAFTLAHGALLGGMLFGVMQQTPEVDALAQGSVGIAICQALALGFDARRLAGWPFARLKLQATQLLGRVFVVQLALMGGMTLFAWRETPGAFFSVFVWLKFLADLGSMVPQYNPREAPRWLAAVMNALPLSRKREGFEAYWRRTTAEEDAEAARDERVSGR